MFLIFPVSKPVRCILTIVLLIFVWSGCTKKHTADRKTGAGFSPIASVLIIQGAKGENDLNLNAYGEVFDSVSLNWRLLSPANLGTIRNVHPGIILVVPSTTSRMLNAPQIQEIIRIVESGAILITEEITPLSQAFGFRAGQTIAVKEIDELAYPKVVIKWQNPAEVTSVIPPNGALLLNRERHSKNALATLVSKGRGKCLLLAAPLDPKHGVGYQRFPYLLKELSNAGIVFPFRSERLAALFDSADRNKAELPGLARMWRNAGIASLHVGAWDFFDLQSDKDDYLRQLVEVCHQNGILVYAWLEWPHVSELFWKRHPQWREKTATGQDAKVDWRSLMDLGNPDCFEAATEALRHLLLEFDWDGVDIAELYFESTAGPEEPESFTPLDKQVRMDFRNRFGIDPVDFFRLNSRHYWKKDQAGWQKFIDYRVELERSLNQRVLQFLSDFRRAAKPSLALILLYVDNIYDPTMREGIGADLMVMLPLLEQYNFTLVMEDPGTVWHLGPKRYEKLALSYAQLTQKTDRFGIDINIVDRDQEVFPTKKQTGGEFLQLFHYAGKHFPTVMAYSEQTMYPQDLELVSYALASDVSAEESDQGVLITTKHPIIFHTETKKKIFMEGHEWPCITAEGIMLPKGKHEISISAILRSEKPRILRLNGTLLDARYAGEKDIDFSYQSDARAIAVFDRPVRLLQVDDGKSDHSGKEWVMLPGGLHHVRAVF